MSFKIHHLNCGSFCPHLSQTLFGVTHLSCHCLLIESAQNLILVDTGLSDLFLKLNKNPLNKFLTRPKFDNLQSASTQIRNLGYSPSDVTDIIATHVDQDHIGAVHEFKLARLHLNHNELAHLNPEASESSKRFSLEYLVNTKEIITYSKFGEDWFGFKAVKQLKHLPPEILLVPLVGHTNGHSGIAVKDGDSWLLHAGDAYFFQEDLSLQANTKSFKREIFQSLDAVHNKNRVLNKKRLAQLNRENSDVQIINSHDHRYFAGTNFSSI